MTIEILDKAENDLVEGYLFYEAQQAALGAYFLESLSSDIESLAISPRRDGRPSRKSHFG